MKDWNKYGVVAKTTDGVYTRDCFGGVEFRPYKIETAIEDEFVRCNPLDQLYPITINRLYGIKNFTIVDKFDIEKVIFNKPATIVLWKDGTKTVVKCGDEAYDPEKGLAMCISKKALGNKGNYFDVFKKHLPKEEDLVLDAFTKLVNALKK